MLHASTSVVTVTYGSPSSYDAIKFTTTQCRLPSLYIIELSFALVSEQKKEQISFLSKRRRRGL